MKKILFSAATLIFAVSMGYSQCTTWLLPSPTTSWTNFVGAGGAPCSLTPPTSTTLPFGAWAAESYTMPNIRQNGSYTFNTCTGAGASAWTPVFTILDPSNNVVAFGRDANSTCALTFTAPVTGTYRIVINRQGSANCGLRFLDASGNDIDGGNPQITYNGGASCDPPVTACNAGTLDLTNTASSLCPEATTTINTIGMIVPNSPTIGGAGIEFVPQAGATGGLIDSLGNSITFRLIGLAAADFPYNIDLTLDGILPANGFPSLSGSWTLRPYVYANQAAPSVKCSETAAVATIDFLAPGGACAADPCDGGDVAAGDQNICPGGDWDLSITGEQVPSQGVVVWVFLSNDDPSGDSDRFLNFGNDPTVYNFSGDLNAFLVAEGLDPIADGSYLTFAGVFDFGTLSYCGFTVGEFEVNVLPASAPACGPVTPPCTLPYPQVTGTNETIQNNGVLLTWNPIPGSLGCEIQGGLASGSGGTQTFQVIQPNLSQFFVPQGQLIAGNTYRWRVRCGCSFTVAGQNSPYRNFLWNPGGGIIELPEDITDFNGRELVYAPKANEGSTGFKNVLYTDGSRLHRLSNLTGDDVRTVRNAAAISEVNTVSSQNSLEVFPNPSNGVVNVRYAAQQDGMVIIRVYDAVGKAVRTINLSVNGGINFANFDLSGLEVGLYNVEVIEGTQRSMQRIVFTK